MSTKTSIKRIAAVAAVALTLGGFSAVSAHAANTYFWVNTADGISNDSSTKSATGNGVAGPANSVKIQIAGADAKDEYYTITGGTFGAASGASNVIVIPTTGTSATVVANGVGGYITIPTPTAGTITVALYRAIAGTGIYGTTAAESVTITVGTAAVAGILNVANSKLYMKSDASTYVDAVTGKGTTTTTNNTQISATVWPTADSTVVASGLTANTAVAEVQAILKDGQAAGGVALNATDTVTATVTSGPGLLIAGSAYATYSGTSARSVSALVSSSGKAYFQILADGTAGVSTITFSDGATILGTKTVTFGGSVAAATVTQNYFIASTTAADDLGTTAVAGALTLSLADSAGNPVLGQAANVKCASSDTTVLATVALGNGSSKVGDNGDGTYEVVANAGSAPVSGASATLTCSVYKADGVTVAAAAPAVKFSLGGTLINSIALSFDAATYAPGDKATASLKALDVKGNPIADGKYAVFTAIGSAAGFAGLTTSAQVTSALFAQTASTGTGTSFLNGAATSTFYVPVVGGPFSASGTLTAASASRGLTAAASVAGTATVSAKAVIANASADAAQAAVDAANEATDAANAATDAANNAMDSADAAQQAALDAGDKADAALAAVTDLATKVSAIASQIAALSALVKKIAAKVKA